MGLVIPHHASQVQAGATVWGLGCQTPASPSYVWTQGCDGRLSKRKGMVQCTRAVALLQGWWAGSMVHCVIAHNQLGCP